MRWYVFPCVLAIAFASGCPRNDDDDKDESTSSSGSGAWIVGDDATMLRVAGVSVSDGYDLDTETDLLAIACKGQASAFVVGTAGTLLATHDRGETWRAVQLDTHAVLRAVATAPMSQVVYVAGDTGAVMRSNDLAESFQRVESPVHDYVGIALDDAGTTAFLLAGDGTIVRHDSDGSEPVRTDRGSNLRAIAASGDGRIVVAVGDGGTMLLSDNSGGSWTAVSTTTARDLHAVRLLDGGERILAIGDAGVLVDIDPSGAAVTELLENDSVLHGMHIDANGHGFLVGSDGIVLASHDAGRTWEALHSGTKAALFGIDVPGAAHPH